MTKDEIKNREKQLLELTRALCTQKLNDEYYQLCEKLILNLGRKKEAPFKRGKIEIWAAAVVYAIGSVNFLFDKSFEPFMTTGQINEHFGTKNTTVSNKARLIRDMFDMSHFNPEYLTREVYESNPLNSMVMVDGFIVPLDSLSEDLQEIVKNERAEGRDIEFTTHSE